MTPNRYTKQVLFKDLGESGQQRLLQSRVTLVGCGALGSTSASLLARAGIGTLRIIDRDFVELDNLQRQVLFDERDAREGLPKAEAAAAKLRQINSEVRIEPLVADLDFSNAEELLQESHLVVDGTDNFDTRFLINDVCVKRAIPWVYAGCVGSYGMVMPIVPGKTACFRCALKDLPESGSTPTCDTAGVLNSAVGVIASLQVTEAVKLLIGRHDKLQPGMATVDVWNNAHHTFRLAADPDCPCCGRRQFDSLNGRVGGRSVMLCGRNAVQVSPPAHTSLNLEDLARKLALLGQVRSNPFLLRFAINGYEMTIFPDGRAIIKGTEDPAQAKSLYARYIGT